MSDVSTTPPIADPLAQAAAANAPASITTDPPAPVVEAPVDVVAPDPAPVVTPEPAPVVDDGPSNAELLAAVANLTARLDATPGTPAGEPEPEPEPLTENAFAKGNIVVHTYVSPYDGEVSRYGIVVDTLPDEGAGARSVIAWFDGVSGPMGDQFLAAV